MKPNNAIRDKARKSGVYLWQIAMRLGVAETTLIRWMREDLPDKKRQRILEAIDEIKEEEE